MSDQLKTSIKAKKKEEKIVIKNANQEKPNKK